VHERQPDDHVHPLTRSSPAAYAAAAWAFVFAAMSFYWALGGRLGIGTQAATIRERIDEPGFVAVLWATGGLKVVAGLVALALVRPWGRRLPPRLVRWAASATAGLLLLYGTLGWVQAILWETGVHDIPSEVGAIAARWKLIFWEPFWMLGGLLFLLAVVRPRR
jgi:hypothetical protein